MICKWCDKKITNDINIIHGEGFCNDIDDPFTDECPETITSTSEEVIPSKNCRTLGCIGIVWAGVYCDNCFNEIYDSE